MARRLTWLDGLLFGIRKIWNADGEELPERPNVQLVGTAVESIEDDPPNNRTVVTLNAAAGVVSLSVVAPLENTGTAEDVELELTGEISDDNHGERAGGDLHAAATTMAAGFMSAADKSKLNGVGAGAAVTAVSVTGPIGNSGTSTTPTITWSPSANVPMGGHSFTGCAGIANASGAVDIDGSGIVSLCTTTGSDCRIGRVGIPVLVRGDTIELRRDDLANSPAAGNSVFVRNNTAATSGVTIQQGPPLVQSGSAWVSGAAATHGVRWRLVPRTSGNVDHVLETTTNGTSWTQRAIATTSSTSLFVPGFGAGRFICTGGDGFVFDSYDGSGVSCGVGGSDSLQIRCYSVDDPLILRGDESVEIKSGGDNIRTVYEPTGAVTHSVPDGVIVTRNHGPTAGTRVTIEGENDFTSVNNSKFTVLSFAIPSSCSGWVELIVTAADVTNGDRAAFERSYDFGRHNGGTPDDPTLVKDHVRRDDATHTAAVERDGNNLIATWAGDSANQCVGRFEWKIHYHTYTPV